MKHKKIVMIMLLVIMSLSLIACGGAPVTSGGDLPPTTETLGANFAVSDITESQDEGDNKNESKNVEIEAFNTEATIEETVLLDENDVKITATDLSYTNYSIELNLVIENNGDKDLQFISNSLAYSCNAINGYMVDAGYLNVDVAAGKKANESISFRIDELTLYGINEIADIQVGFDILDDDYNHIYSGPRQVKTSVADSYDYGVDTYSMSLNSGVLEATYDCEINYFAEDEVYNQDGISIVSEALMTNKSGEKIILLEVENNSSEYVYGVTTGISVNGLVLYSSTWSSDSLNPGTRRILDLSLSSMLDKTYWDTFGISDIGKFACSFTVQDAAYTEMIAPQEISIDVSQSSAALDTSGMELYNENGIRFIWKGTFEDSSEYSDDLHILLLIENNYSEAIRVDDVYDSLAINSFMTDYSASRMDIPTGRYGVIDVQIWESSLERNGIAGIDDIIEAEISFEIKDTNRKTVAEPQLSIQY